MNLLVIITVLILFLIPLGITLIFVPKLLNGTRTETNGCTNYLLLLSSTIIFFLVIYIGSTLLPVIPESLAIFLGLTVILLQGGIYLAVIISGWRLNKKDILLDLRNGQGGIYLFWGLVVIIVTIIAAYVF